MPSKIDVHITITRDKRKREYWFTMNFPIYNTMTQTRIVDNFLAELAVESYLLTLPLGVENRKSVNVKLRKEVGNPLYYDVFGILRQLKTGGADLRNVEINAEFTGNQVIELVELGLTTKDKVGYFDSVINGWWLDYEDRHLLSLIACNKAVSVIDYAGLVNGIRSSGLAGKIIERIQANTDGIMLPTADYHVSLKSSMSSIKWM